MRNRILIICTLLSLATCAHMPAPEQSEFAMPVALVRYLATHPSYMTSNSTYVYEPFSAGNSTTTKIPPELLADLAGKGIRFSQGPNMTDREARRDFDLAQLGIRAQVPRADGDYDVSYNFSVFLVGGGYYGSSGKAVMRLNAAGWRVLDTAITQFSRGNWR